MTHFAKTHALFLAEGGAPWFTDTFCEGFGFAWGSLPFTKLTFFGPKVQDIFFLCDQNQTVESTGHTSTVHGLVRPAGLHHHRRQARQILGVAADPIFHRGLVIQ